jgi:RimJ/RimL family protein N-acetyltransferase
LRFLPLISELPDSVIEFWSIYRGIQPIHLSRYFRYNSAVEPVNFQKFQLVSATEKYFTFIRDLRNNPQIRSSFIEQEFIAEASHLEYMAQYSSFYFVCLEENEPIGYVGVVLNDIRIATSPLHAGRGAGTFMLQEIVKLFPKAKAKIKIENEASMNLFEKLGFQKKYYLLERDSE